MSKRQHCYAILNRAQLQEILNGMREESSATASFDFIVVEGQDVNGSKQLSLVEATDVKELVHKRLY